MFGGRGEFTLGPYSNRTFYLFIYIYIYKTEAFEAPTIFHVTTIFFFFLFWVLYLIYLLQ